MPRFIRVDTDFPDHPKTLRFMRLCGNPLAPFSLIRLWLWAADRRPDGDLFQMDGEDLERAAGWPGTPGKFYFALQECGFIDGASGAHTLHGWVTRQGYFCRESLRKAHGKRKCSRAKRARVARTEERIGEERIGDKKIIDLGEVSPRPSLAQPSVERVDAEQPEFVTFWTAYPRKVGKGAARKAWAKVRPSQALAAKIIAAVEAQKAWPAWTKDDGKYIPHPTTWLNQTRWEDEGDSPTEPWEPPNVRAAKGKRDGLIPIFFPDLMEDKS